MLISGRKFLRRALIAADIVTLAVAYAAAYWTTEHVFGRRFSSPRDYAWLLWVLGTIWPICLEGFGLYHSSSYKSRANLLARLARAQTAAGLILLAFMYATRSEQVSRLLMHVFLAESFLLLAAQRLALRFFLLHRGRARGFVERRKVLLVAAPDRALSCLKLFEKQASIFADVVGLLIPACANYGGAAMTNGFGVPVLGCSGDLSVALRNHVIDEVMVVPPIGRDELDAVTARCAARGLDVRIVVEVPRGPLGAWLAEEWGDEAYVLSLAAVPQDALRLFIKRALDIAGAMAGLALCGLAWLWCGRRLRRETGGSALFRQQRVGQNGRRFTLYKFRTMHADAGARRAELAAQNEMRGPMFKLKHDPRITPAGLKLRRRHLDELPQFWNVLRGEMSMVGTRPPTEDEVAAYDEHHHRRLSMKPGITGLWQLNGNGKVHNFEEVVKLDCQYIDNWSLWLDFKVLAKTVAKVMRGDAW